MYLRCLGALRASAPSTSYRVWYTPESGRFRRHGASPSWLHSFWALVIALAQQSLAPPGLELQPCPPQDPHEAEQHLNNGERGERTPCEQHGKSAVYIAHTHHFRSTTYASYGDQICVGTERPRQNILVEKTCNGMRQRFHNQPTINHLVNRPPHIYVSHVIEAFDPDIDTAVVAAKRACLTDSRQNVSRRSQDRGAAGRVKRRHGN